MERAGLGPDEALARNPRLVYGRVTGYGQEGPLSQVAGHDINYISLAGVLGAISRHGDRPLAPMNLVADYGGGGMLLAFGVVCALLEARSSGQGQVIDAAMVEGASLLATVMHGLMAMGIWSTEAGTNVLDSGAHFYEVYECADGKHISVGAIEPQFYDELLRLLEISHDEAPQWSKERWPEIKELFAAKFRTRTRDEWAAILEPAEACATPVLTLAEAPSHPHNVARGSFVDSSGVVQPHPAPRFSRTPAEIETDVPSPDAALAAWGLSQDEIGSLFEPASQG
jgi:alpha-methylacyl-CoA racemase